MDNDSPELKEQIMSERRFLHDISNHIVVAQGMASLVQKSLKDNPNVGQAEMDRLGKALDALKKLTDELKARREVLHNMSS